MDHPPARKRRVPGPTTAVDSDSATPAKRHRAHPPPQPPPPAAAASSSSPAVAAATPSPSPLPAALETPLARFLRVGGLQTDAEDFTVELKMEPVRIDYGDVATMHNVGDTQARVRFVCAGTDRCTLSMVPERPMYIELHKMRFAQLVAAQMGRRRELYTAMAEHRSVWTHLGLVLKLSHAPAPDAASSSSATLPKPPRHNIELHAVHYTLDTARARIELRVVCRAKLAVRVALRLVAKRTVRVNSQPGHEEEEDEDAQAGSLHEFIFDAPMVHDPHGHAPEAIALQTARRWVAVFGTQHIFEFLEELTFRIRVYADERGEGGGPGKPLVTLTRWSLPKFLGYFAAVADLVPGKKIEPMG